MNYQGKIILITGAYRGIGKYLALKFASLGANIILTYHNHEELTKKLQEEIKEKHLVDVDCVYLDLCQEKSISNLYNYVNKKYDKIDILINNAALSIDDFILDKKKEDFMKVLETNVVGTFLMMKYFDSIVDGYIFNMSSTDGIDTGSMYSIDYNASKASINVLTKTFSLYSKNKIISICPNWVDTESTREMDKNYLDSELKRIKQSKLINISTIFDTINKCLNCDIASGSIIMIEGEKNEEFR